MPVSLVVRELAFGVRPVRLRLPFKFGAVTLQACRNSSCAPLSRSPVTATRKASPPR